MSSLRTLSHDWFPRPLPSNVELADGVWLYSAFAFLHCRSRKKCAVKVGRSSGIYNGTFFELGPNGEVHIGDYATLVGAIVATNGRVRVGDYCFVAHEVYIGDSPFGAPEKDVKCRPDREGAGQRCIDIGDDVWIGAGAVLLAGAKIGDGAIIGAAAVVDFEVPPCGIVGGNPGRLVGFAREA